MIARVAYSPISASGGRHSWAVHVSAIDRRHTDERCLIGGMLPPMRQVELEDGDLVAEVVPWGSRKHGGWEMRLSRVSEGELRALSLAEVDRSEWPEWETQRLDCLDLVEEQLARETPDPPPRPAFHVVFGLLSGGTLALHQGEDGTEAVVRYVLARSQPRTWPADAQVLELQLVQGTDRAVVARTSRPPGPATHEPTTADSMDEFLARHRLAGEPDLA